MDIISGTKSIICPNSGAIYQYTNQICSAFKTWKGYIPSYIHIHDIYVYTAGKVYMYKIEWNALRFSVDNLVWLKGNARLYLELDKTKHRNIFFVCCSFVLVGILAEFNFINGVFWEIVIKFWLNNYLLKAAGFQRTKINKVGKHNSSFDRKVLTFMILDIHISINLYSSSNTTLLCYDNFILLFIDRHFRIAA